MIYTYRLSQFLLALFPNTVERTHTLPVFGTDIRHDVLVEELEDEWDTVGKHQVLGDDLKLQKKRRKRNGVKCIAELKNKRFFSISILLCGRKSFSQMQQSIFSWCN